MSFHDLPGKKSKKDEQTWKNPPARFVNCFGCPHLCCLGNSPGAKLRISMAWRTWSKELTETQTVKGLRPYLFDWDRGQNLVSCRLRRSCMVLVASNPSKCFPTPTMGCLVSLMTSPPPPNLKFEAIDIHHFFGPALEFYLERGHHSVAGSQRIRDGFRKFWAPVAEVFQWTGGDPSCFSILNPAPPLRSTCTVSVRCESIQPLLQSSNTGERWQLEPIGTIPSSVGFKFKCFIFVGRLSAKMLSNCLRMRLKERIGAACLSNPPTKLPGEGERSKMACALITVYVHCIWYSYSYCIKFG